MDSRFWLTEGRGSYAWDDDRYREEFKDAAVELLAAIDPLRKMAANLTSGLHTTAEVVQARIDLKKLVLAITAERDVAKAEAAKLKAELAAEENNCPYPDFSCGTFAAERGIELRPAGGPTYTTTSDHWQGILRDLDAARAGEARAVEAIKALLTELHEFDFEIDGSVEFFDSVQQCRDATDNTQPAIDWLAQREREAVVAELRDWAERWWESHSDFSAGDFNQRIAALRNQQPTACSRSEVRGKENNNA
jgi:hypothetical protein